MNNEESLHKLWQPLLRRFRGEKGFCEIEKMAIYTWARRDTCTQEFSQALLIIRARTVIS